MKKLSLIFLLATAAILVACDTKELSVPEGPLPSRDKVPLQLTSGISTTRGITRAYDTFWDDGNEIGVFTTVAGSGSSSENPYVITNSGSQPDSNIKYVISTGGNTYDGTKEESQRYSYMSFTATTDGEIYLPADGSDVDVYAYYPWTHGVTASSPLNITIPGVSTAQTLSQQKAVDVLMAKALSSESTIDIDHTTAQLLFSHVLSKAIIIVKYGTGYSYSDLDGRVTVEITGQPVSAKFNPISPTISEALTIIEGSNSIIPCEITGESDPDKAMLSGDNVVCAYRALLLPNNAQNPATDTDRKIVFTVGAKTPGATTTTYYYDLSNNNTPAVNEIPAGSPNVFETGKATIFTLTLAATGITVKAAIIPWSTEAVTPEPLYED